MTDYLNCPTCGGRGLLPAAQARSITEAQRATRSERLKLLALADSTTEDSEATP